MSKGENEKMCVPLMLEVQIIAYFLPLVVINVVIIHVNTQFGLSLIPIVMRLLQIC